MAKLKFDRSINLELDKDNSVTVPKDEVWKGFLSAPNGNSGDLKINGNTVLGGSNSAKTVGTHLLGGGTNISGTGTVTGVAFKIIS